MRRRGGENADATRKRQRDTERAMEPEEETEVEKVRALRLKLETQAPRAASLGEIEGIDSKQITEVLELESDDVLQRIEELVVKVVEQVLSGHGLSYTRPIRSSGNIGYVKELDRIVLKDKMTTREFAHTSTVR
eukprot:EC723314.1.p2 GENE.EC723314.1~~EC723314.1.p2  ORF type:complete len:134 (+),score=29.87 EC723314.1:95-496(+)